MNDLTLKAAQRQLDDYISRFKIGYFPPLSQLARLTEEVGELAREVMDSYGEKPKKASEPLSNVAEELTDVLINLIIFANSLEIDLQAQFQKNMEKFESRDAMRFERIEQSEG
ncbi:MAG: nucleotide pyrophosphohydrolase [Streptococcaceae bacterium]|jgi:NTP pyrophosphatase (non-canonical NTP hydrolase)|nr:nucleotide pyrophosphohydrolase [Streptococcaceae bacterium]